MEQIEFFEETLKRADIFLSSQMLGQFSRYQELLLLWNQKINLISRKDEARIVTKHFLESLGLVKVIRLPHRTTVLDLGSGAGFPGLPIKIIRPDIRIILVESKYKKILFLKELVKKLDLTGIEVVQGRVEKVGKTIDPVRFVFSRAVADLVSLVKWSQNCMHSQGGVLIAIKGSAAESELEQLNRVSSDLGVTGWQMEKYDPFPAVMLLKETFIVAIQMRASPKSSLIN